MRIAITIAALLMFAKAKAQELRSIVVKNKTVDLVYDTITQVQGTRFDTTTTKSTTKFKGSETTSVKTSYSRTAITKADTIRVTKTYLKPVEMKFVFNTMLATVFTVIVNGQEFHASKYGFGWIFDTSGTAQIPAPQRTVYGALWATWSGSQAITATNTFYPFNEIRASVTFPTWNGENSPIAEQYLSAGKRVLLNVHGLQQGTGASFADVDLAEFQADATTLVNSISVPDSVVLSCFNEEGNRNYSVINTPSDLENYVKCLSILSRTAKTRNIKASNGGITTNALVFTTYRYLSDTNNPDTTDFMNYVVPRNWWNGLRNRNSDAIEEVIANTQYLLTRYDTIPAIYMPYVSAHMYFPLAKRITDTATNWRPDYTGIDQVKEMLDYYVPGRDIITNEMGLLVTDTDVVSNVVADLGRNNFRHIIYWNTPEVSEVMAIASGPTTPTALGAIWLNEITQ